MDKLTLKQKLAMQGIKITQKVAVRQAHRRMINLANKHKSFVKEIQEKCGEIIELETEKEQAPIVALVCSNIIQGFDTKEEMNLTIEMIQTAINKYWEQENIPQRN